jgi:hypothetical protein
MNTKLIKRLIAAAALAVAGSVGAQEAEKPVPIRTDGLPSHVRARLEAKAQEGSAALIQYVNRTRMMGHQVRVEDIVEPSKGTFAAQKERKEPKVASTADAAAK